MKHIISHQNIASRLRPYQEDSVRFMIHRELNSQVALPVRSLSCSTQILPSELERVRPPPTRRAQLFLLQEPRHIHEESCGVSFPVHSKEGLEKSYYFSLPQDDLSVCGGILADEMGLGKTVSSPSYSGRLLPSCSPRTSQVELLTLICTVTPENTPEIENEPESSRDLNEQMSM